MSKILCSVLLAAGAAFAAVAPAQAAPLQWSVTIGAPWAVYGPPLSLQYAPVGVGPACRRGAYQRPTRWDHDGDRIPNRHDRL